MWDWSTFIAAMCFIIGGSLIMFVSLYQIPPKEHKVEFYIVRAVDVILGAIPAYGGIIMLLQMCGLI